MGLEPGACRRVVAQRADAVAPSVGANGGPVRRRVFAAAQQGGQDLGAAVERPARKVVPCGGDPAGVRPLERCSRRVCRRAAGRGWSARARRRARRPELWLNRRVRARGERSDAGGEREATAGATVSSSAGCSGNGGENQEGGEDHEVDGALQDVGSAGAERDAADEKVSTSSTRSLGDRPSVRGRPSAMESTATTGMVKPMLARAEPSARLRLVCRRSERAARYGGPGLRQ